MPHAGIEASSAGIAVISVSQNGEAIHIVRNDWSGSYTPRWWSTNLWNDTIALVGGVAFDDDGDIIGAVCMVPLIFSLFLICVNLRLWRRWKRGDNQFPSIQHFGSCG